MVHLIVLVPNAFENDILFFNKKVVERFIFQKTGNFL